MWPVWHCVGYVLYQKDPVVFRCFTVQIPFKHSKTVNFFDEKLLTFLAQKLKTVNFFKPFWKKIETISCCFLFPTKPMLCTTNTFSNAFIYMYLPCCAVGPVGITALVWQIQMHLYELMLLLYHHPFIF